MKPLVGTELKRFLRRYRRAHPPARQVAALLQSVEYPVNVGSVFRLAEAAGLAELVLTGITPRPPNVKLEKVARFKVDLVPWRYEEDPVAAIAGLRQTGYHIVAVELTDRSTPYFAYPFPSQTCLVVGHEDHGVTRATLAACDAAVFVPMYGKGRSLNVHVALSVVVYHLLHADPPAPHGPE